MRATTLALVALFTLAAPMQAWAECAWVLWQDGTRVRGSAVLDQNWALLSGWPSHSTCEKARTQQLTSLEKRFSKVQKFSPDSVTATWDDGSVTTFQPVCFPDTIDPRGPKGGGR